MINWRTPDRREVADAIIRLLNTSANGNGGASLLYEFYVNDCSWHSFTKREQKIRAVTIRRFAKELRDEGFLPDPYPSGMADR
jgi:hypothetical protein